MRPIFLTLLLLIRQSFAQTASPTVGARQAGMGNNSVSTTDGASLLNNVGSLGRIENTGAFFTYEARPALTGADRMAAMINIKTNHAAWGLGLLRFGDDVYNEQTLHAGYSHLIGNTSVGMSATLFQTRAIGFETKSSLALNFGVLTRLSRFISVGAFMSNVTQAQMSGQFLPTRLVAGLAIRASENFLIVSEVDKDLSYPVSWRLGAEYRVHRKIFFRSGFTNYPLTSSFGIGLLVKKLTNDYSVVFNRDTGTLFQASAGYRLTSPRKKP